jgi:predicted neutral ceramidase superfamily lipid hydrolase
MKTKTDLVLLIVFLSLSIAFMYLCGYIFVEWSFTWYKLPTLIIVLMTDMIWWIMACVALDSFMEGL